MKNPLKRITVLFVLASLLPIAYVVFEISALNDNEKLVREIYRNQLDAMLYSVNQYTNDVVANWAKLVESDAKRFNGLLPSDPNSYTKDLHQSGVIKYLLFGNANDQYEWVSFNKESPDEIPFKAEMVEVAKTRKTRVQQLMKYYQSGYQKMDALDTIVGEVYMPILFAIKDVPNIDFCMMWIHVPKLLSNLLGPKMQGIAQDNFVMSAFTQDTDSLVYSTEPFKAAVFEVKDESQKRKFWLLPGYYLGISSKVATIDDLLKERSRNGLIILTLLMLTLVSGVILVYRNTTRQVQLSAAKAEFVSNVSHEIRTPLALISMFAETLELGRIRKDEKKQEYYSIISRETRRLSRIVDRILNFSQIDANKKQYSFKPLTLNDICTEVMDSYSFHLTNLGFIYEISLEAKNSLIMGDEETVAEILINLLDNAIKYSDSRKHIVVKTFHSDGHVNLSVADSGIGIEKKHLEDIFEQFYRVPTGDVHDIKGSGLGLSLVDKMVKAHQGIISVDSTPGKGTTFIISFPLAKNEYEYDA